MTTEKTTAAKAKAAGAKVPADRAAKAEATGEPIEVAFDVDGIDFKFEIDPDALDDAEALEAMENNIPTKMFAAIAGDHNEEFRDRLREESGRLRVSSMAKFVAGAMQAIGQGKR